MQRSSTACIAPAIPAASAALRHAKTASSGKVTRPMMGGDSIHTGVALALGRKIPGSDAAGAATSNRQSSRWTSTLRARPAPGAGAQRSPLGPGSAWVSAIGPSGTACPAARSKVRASMVSASGYGNAAAPAARSSPSTSAKDNPDPP
ncbi:hypothetical protein D9M68_705190 [compost metagenome]